MPQYQGVWTLEQQAQALTNQQWVTDPNFKNTTLLLQADGTGSGSQNQTFLDGSTNNFFITRNGNTTQGSFSPFSQAPGYWGNYTSSGNYLSVASNAAFAYGTGAITIEFWEWSTTTPTSAVEVWVSNGSNNLNIQRSSGGFYNVYDGTDRVSTTTVLSNQWNHVAFVRQSGGQTNLYVNGVSVLSWTSSVNYGNDTFVIAGSGSFPFPGYISNIRVLKGTSLYTAAFTPPTSPLTAITNTSLLTCQSNRFVDNSASPLTLTITGSPSVQAFGPFAPALQWTPDVVGGSGYYDGSGDYLTYAPGAGVAFGTGDFTVEFWIYPLTSISQVYLMDARNSGQTSSWAIGFNLNNTGAGQFTFFNGVAGAAYNESSQSCVLNQWNHCVVVRSGTTFSMFTNGTRVFTTTNSTNFSSSQTLSYIARGQGTGSEFYYTGYMVSNRIVKGTAVYSPSATTLTVPTIPLTAITNTQLLLGCTNAGIYDGKMANNLETVGNAQVATSPVKYGSGSMYFNGSSAITARLSDFFSFGTGDFTIEAWIYITTTGTGTIIDARSADVINAYIFNATSANKLQFIYGSSLSIVSTTVLSNNIWTHVAVCRANGVIRIFVNGVVDATTATYTSAINAASFAAIGGGRSSGSDAVTGYYFNGYIDDFRISKVARYIANFTPPQQALPRQ